MMKALSKTMKQSRLAMATSAALMMAAGVAQDAQAVQLNANGVGQVPIHPDGTDLSARSVGRARRVPYQHLLQRVDGKSAFGP